MYQEMYFHLFRSITVALKEIAANNYGNAATVLREAQSKTEEIYMKAEGETVKEA